MKPWEGGAIPNCKTTLLEACHSSCATGVTNSPREYCSPAHGRKEHPPCHRAKTKNINGSDDPHSSKSPLQTFFPPQIHQPFLFCRSYLRFPSCTDRQTASHSSKEKILQLVLWIPPFLTIHELLFFGRICHTCILSLFPPPGSLFPTHKRAMKSPLNLFFIFS